MRLSRFVPEAEVIPLGYGVAYRSFAMAGTVCYPIPLNLIVRLAREVHGKLYAPRWGGVDKLVCGAEYRGYEKARAEFAKDLAREFERGVREGRQRYVAEVLADLDERRRSHREAR